MSAIFGIINKKQKCVDSHLVGSMLEALKHRATDGSQIVVDNNMGMGNCRLNIYPQQIYEKQPLKIGQFTITSDARIDNRQELARHFNIDNNLLNVTPDSTLILMAYQEWEDMCINHLEGEFAFAIWDEKAEKLFAATDQIGFRPLYYYNTPDAFIFCSEIKGITAIKTTPNFFNEESLIEYFYREGDWQQTFNKEILSLCGGNSLIMKEGKLSIRKYWKLEPANRYHFTKDEEWYECFKDLIYKAIEKRLNYDLPVGLTLSGGLDSGCIACVLSELLMKKNKPLYTFSSVLPSNHDTKEKDERKYIELIDKHCPNIIQTYECAPGIGIFSNLEKSFNLFESFPSSSFYMDIKLLEAAKKKGVKMLYTGFGGDFFVSWKGDSVIYELIKQGDYQSAFMLIRKFMKNDNKSFLEIFREMYASHTDVYQRLRSVIRNDLDELKRNSMRRDTNLKYSGLISNLVNEGFVAFYLNRIYNFNESQGIESEMPLFDKNIYEFLIEMPIQLFVKDGIKRNLIRRTMQGILPEEILLRKDKMPFLPGYVQRTYHDIDKLKVLCTSEKYQFVFKKYVNRDVFNFCINNISTTNISHNNEALKAARIGVVTYLLGYMDAINYIHN